MGLEPPWSLTSQRSASQGQLSDHCSMPYSAQRLVQRNAQRQEQQENQAEHRQADDGDGLVVALLVGGAVAAHQHVGRVSTAVRAAR